MWFMVRWMWFVWLFVLINIGGCSCDEVFVCVIVMLVVGYCSVVVGVFCIVFCIEYCYYCGFYFVVGLFGILCYWYLLLVLLYLDGLYCVYFG